VSWKQAGRETGAPIGGDEMAPAPRRGGREVFENLRESPPPSPTRLRFAIDSQARKAVDSARVVVAAIARVRISACGCACVRACVRFPRCGDPRLGCIVRDRAWVRARARAPSRLRCTDDLGKLRDPARFSRCDIAPRRLGSSVLLSSGSML